MAWWTNFISLVQLFPSRTRPPRGQMAPKQLLVSQYIWRHSWNDKSDGATSSSYTKPLFRTFSLVLVCYKQNLMCENKIKLSSFTAPRWSFTFTAFITAALSLPHFLHLHLKPMHILPDNDSPLGLRTLTVSELPRVQSRLTTTPLVFALQASSSFRELSAEKDQWGRWAEEGTGTCSLPSLSPVGFMS